MKGEFQATQSRWDALLDGYRLITSETSVVFNVLDTLYSDPRRRYHTFNHISDCLNLLDYSDIIAEPRDRFPVELAIWFHDCIYNTNRQDNELQSARCANFYAQGLKFNEEYGRRIEHLVLATKHDKQETSLEQQLICDIDLASLGASPEEFDKNSENIRYEYSWVPKDEYERSRDKILSGFFSRQRIYYTAFFYDNFEAQARINLNRVLTRGHVLLPYKCPECGRQLLMVSESEMVGYCEYCQLMLPLDKCARI